MDSKQATCQSQTGYIPHRGPTYQGVNNYYEFILICNLVTVLNFLSNLTVIFFSFDSSFFLQRILIINGNKIRCHQDTLQEILLEDQKL